VSRKITEGSPSEACSLPSALKCRREIEACAENRRIAVFLDYDGTLTPIVDRPGKAVLSGKMRQRLAKLSRSLPVGIISGRDLQDVRARVGLDAIVYAGSHGFDIHGPDFSYRQGLDFLPALDGAERQLNERLRPISGARVDRKLFAIAVHYRQVADEDVQAVERVVNEVVSMHSELRKSTGKAIFELKPDTDWDKGRALIWILEKMDLDRPDALPFYIGDDTTDEDAFRDISNRGIGVLVRSDSRPTWARYALETPGEVGRFLTFLQSLRPF